MDTSDVMFIAIRFEWGMIGGWIGEGGGWIEDRYRRISGNLLVIFVASIRVEVR
jgi:hypothetical protein